jgi:hypothetical protein
LRLGLLLRGFVCRGRPCSKEPSSEERNIGPVPLNFLFLYDEFANLSAGAGPYSLPLSYPHYHRSIYRDPDSISMRQGQRIRPKRELSSGSEMLTSGTEKWFSWRKGVNPPRNPAQISLFKPPQRVAYHGRWFGLVDLALW